MNSWWADAGLWWMVTAIGGAVVLTVTALTMRRSTSSALRQRLGECGVMAAVLLAVLRFTPSWWSMPDPRPVTPSAVTRGQRTVPQEPEEPAEVAQAPMLFALQSAVVTDMPAMQLSPPDPVALTPTNNAIPNAQTSAATEFRFPIWECLGIAYVAIALLLLGRWAIAHWALARIIRKARPAPEPLQLLFERMAVDADQPDARLLISENIPVPLCCGLRRPVVVIPRKLALVNDPNVLRWVFAHELTHLARRDPWSTWFMGLAQALYFFLPPFWWVRRQVRLCQEYIADAAAAAQGEWADEYAQFLVNLAGSRTAPVAATGVLAQTSDLFRRVTMVLQPTESTGREWSRRKLMTGAACLLASAVIFAGLGVRDAGADDAKKKASKEKVIKSDDGNVEVIVVDSDDAKAKDGEKKKELRARIVAADEAFKVFGDDDLEKRLRKALEKAKLDKDEIEKIVKDVVKAHEKMHFAIKSMPALGGNLPAIAPLPGGGVKFGAEGVPGGLWVAHGQGGSGGGGRLGVVIDKPSGTLVEQLDLPADQGLVIVEVRKDSAADKAGLKANDILLRFNNKAVVNDPNQLVKVIEGLAADKEIDAVVIRKGRKETISGIKLAEKKKESGTAFFDAGSGEGPARKMIIRKLEDAKGPAARKVEDKKSRNVSVTIKDGELSAKDSDGTTTIVVTGKVDGGKITVSSISIDEPGVKSSYDSIDEVPAKYRDRVKKLIANTGDSPVRFEFRKEKKDD